MASVLSVAMHSMAEARIGESQSTIERRLFASGGIVYRDDVIETSRQRGMPYLKFTDYFPESAQLRIYYKTDDGRKPKSSQMEEKRISDGWDVHVLYVRGKSVLEVYKRSKGMSDYEFNILLQLQADGGFWKKVEKTEQEEGAEEPPPSAFGFQMERSDGQVRAKKLGGDSLMIFNTELDMRLAQSQEADLQELAPLSVSGF